MQKVVLAFDSFKGSISASDACRVVAGELKRLLPHCQIVEMPVADGGEGTTEAICRCLKAHIVECRVCGPMGETLQARYAITPDGTTAIMEMAAAAGLVLVPQPMRNPMKASTIGVGEMMLDAARRGCRRVVIGIGGSATCDGGMGMLYALGWRFEDSEGRLLQPSGAALARVSRAVPSEEWARRGIQTDIVCDVSSPLLGNRGAARVFAPQKGASPADVELLEAGMQRYAEAVRHTTGTYVAGNPGAGAAGGLGFALMHSGGVMHSGAEYILSLCGMDRHLSGASLVITGEGCIDRQTAEGKVPLAVLCHARQHAVPCAVIAGQVRDPELLLSLGFASLHALVPTPCPDLAEAMLPANTAASLRRCAAECARLYK